MQSKKIKGVVLRYVNLRENDRLLTLLTADGRVDALCRGARKVGSGRLAACDVLTYAAYELSAGKGGVQIKEARVLRAHYALRLDMPKTLAGLHMLEVCAAVSQDASDARALLALLLRGLRYLEGAGDARCVAAWFLLCALRAEGFAVSTETCAQCAQPLPLKGRDAPVYMDAARGGFVCAQCTAGKTPLDSLAARWMQAAARDQNAQALFAFPAQGMAAFSLLQDHLCHHIERAFKAGTQLAAWPG